MKIKNWMKDIVVTLTLVFLIIGCTNPGDYEPEDISLMNWNKETIAFALSNCEFSKNEYNQDSMPLIKDENGNLVSLKKDLLNILNSRQYFIDTLVKTDFFSTIKGPIVIGEYHNRTSQKNGVIAMFDVYINFDSVYSFSLDKKKNVVIKKSADQNLDYLNLDNDQKCINDLAVGYLLDLILIKSEINKDEKSEITSASTTTTTEK